MANWEFYGRQDEMEKLRVLLQLGNGAPAERSFTAFVIGGRRGVGKNALLTNTVSRCGGPASPLMVVQLPAGDEGKCLKELLRVAGRTAPGTLLDDMPARGRYDYDAARFADIAMHLLNKGVILCLDEFHHAKKAELESPIKLLIDDVATARRQGGRVPPGKLVMMGSHQQRISAMFADDQPLHLRARVRLRLQPWEVPTVLEMAGEHGWLSNPGRFLTLWSAYDGMPYLWERLALDDERRHLRDYRVITDDREWRQAFLNAERRTLIGDERECFDNRAMIELPDEMRDALLWMGRNPRRKRHVSEFPVSLRSAGPGALVRILQRLERNLRLVICRTRFTGWRREEPVWEIADNNILFQLHVFRDMFQPVQPFPPGPESRRPPPTEALETLEGAMLERLSADWLASCPGVEWSVTCAKARGSGEADIDVLARFGSGGYLAVGSCKRNAALHNPRRLLDDFKRFLRASGGEANDIKGLSLRPILFSPQFTAEQKSRYAGVECVDIPAMAGGPRRLRDGSANRMREMQPAPSADDTFC